MQNDDSSRFFGRPVPRKEDLRFLTGRGCFVDDIHLPGMAHAAVLRSPVAHGRIRGIDLSKARAHGGALAILVAADIEGSADYVPLVQHMHLPGYERFLEWPLARDVVRFVGEPLAIVAAETRYLAEDIVDLIEVDIEELPAVVTIDDAIRDDVLVNEEAGTNFASRYQVSRGDVEAAFRDAHYTRKEVFRVHRHSGIPLETRGFLSHWDAAAGIMRCYGANKIPRRTRDALAPMLGLAPEQVIMIENDAGGNFGVRGQFYPEDFLVAFLARSLDRPVKYIEDRREHFMMTNHSREAGCELEIAVSAQGRITGMRSRLYTDLGAYVTSGGSAVVPAKTVQFIPGPYDIENFACDVNVMATNKTPIGAFRGPGRYEASFFCERMIDMAAHDLGLDPVEFRRRNLISEAQMPYRGGNLVPYMGESSYDTGNYGAVLERALAEFGHDRLAGLSGTLVDGRYHGVAVCCYTDSTGVGPSEDARIVIGADGSVAVYVGTSSSGQGTETVMAQIAADALGLHPTDIEVFHGSTDIVEMGFGHGHSRGAVMGGSAVHLAATRMAARLASLASLRLNVAADEIRFRDGAVLVEGEDAPALSLAGLVADAVGREGAPLEEKATYRQTALTYSYGTQIAHVAVDPETAEVEVLRFLTVEDVGRAINPGIVHGQALGASVQGISGTFLDEFVYDGNGQLLNGSFADYLVATSTDFPNVEAVTLEEARSELNPLGVKGAGEGAISATGAVLANAVSNALRPLGVEIYDLPLSPNNLSKLIRAARAGTPVRPSSGPDIKLGFHYDAL